MVHYYLDLETYGKGERPDPRKDKILLATICPIDPRSGKPLAEPTFLRSWEIGEAELTKQLVHRLFDNNQFDAVPVGFSLAFDLWFLKHKAMQHMKVDLGDDVFTQKPTIDLKHAMVLANRGVFKGVALGTDGKRIKEWYEDVDLARIERYAQEKLVKFSNEYAKLAKKLQRNA